MHKATDLYLLGKVNCIAEGVTEIKTGFQGWLGNVYVLTREKELKKLGE